jgi:talin
MNYISYLTHNHEKVLLLEQIKSIVETSLQLILSTKESGGNIKNLQWHKIVENNSDLLIKLIQKLVHTLQDQPSSNGVMIGLCENIRKLISTLETTTVTNQGHFADYQSRMVEILRQMARLTKEILPQSNNSENIRQLVNQLTREYHELINATCGAIGTAATKDLAIRIKSVVTELGLTSIELLEKLGLGQQNNSKLDLENLCHKVIEKVILIFFSY